jgi:hypothetical protein
MFGRFSRSITWGITRVVLPCCLTASNAFAAASAGPIIIPEPSTAVMLGIAGGALAIRQWYVGRRRSR